MRFLRRIRYWLRHDAESRALREEMETHRRMAADALGSDRAGGRAMGNTTLGREDARAVWIWPWLEAVVQDVRFAARMLASRPGFTLLAVVTMALGVGVNATMFSVIDYLLFRPPAHVSEPDRLVHLNVENYPNVVNMRERSDAIDVAGYDPVTVVIGMGLEARPVPAEFVSDNYFDVLGVRPQLGRWFLPEEETITAMSPVAVISDGLWSRRFGRDPGALGQGIVVNNAAYTIVGVAPRGFTGALVAPVDLWFPFSDNEAWGVGNRTIPNGGYLSSIGRIRDPFSFEQAIARAATVPRDGLPEVPAPELEVERFGEVRFLGTGVGNETIALWLYGASAVVLLIASANVAGLLLVRVVERRHEVVMRIQLGAGRWRIVRQLLTESAVLGIFAGGVALVIVRYAGPVFHAFLVNPFESDGLLDFRVVGITFLAMTASVLVASVTPAIEALRTNIVEPLKSGQSGSRSRSRWRSAILGIEVGLTLVLLVSAGLFVQSLDNVYDLDYGFDPRDLGVIFAEFREFGYSPEAARRTFEDLLSRAEADPVVLAAGLDTSQPMGGGLAGGFLPPEETEIRSLPMLHTVTSGTLEALGIGMVSGRGFEVGDVAGRGVVIVSERTAEQYWPGRNPIGQCLVPLFASGECFEVIGVAENDRWSLSSEAGAAVVYTLAANSERVLGSVANFRFMFVRVRPGTSLARLSQTLREATPGQPYFEMRSMWSMMDRQLRSFRMGASLFSLFGVLSTVLAVIGIYGVLAFAARQRTPEVGIRLAIGARPRDIVRTIMRDGAVLLGIGTAGGVLVALVIAGYLESQLFGVAPRDPLAFLGAIVLITVVGLAATLIPAWRSSRTDPSVALRHD